MICSLTCTLYKAAPLHVQAPQARGARPSSAPRRVTSRHIRPPPLRAVRVLPLAQRCLACAVRVGTARRPCARRLMPARPGTLTRCPSRLCCSLARRAGGQPGPGHPGSRAEPRPTITTGRWLWARRRAVRNAGQHVPRARSQPSPSRKHQP